MNTLRYRILPHSGQAPFSLPELFADLAVADICDALGRNAALPSAIKPLGAARLLGTAYTVNLPAGENLLLYYAVDNARPGDVLAVACDGYEDRAVCGPWIFRSMPARFHQTARTRTAAAKSTLPLPWAMR